MNRFTLMAATVSDASYHLGPEAQATASSGEGGLSCCCDYPHQFNDGEDYLYESFTPRR
jgi:hypothetical protein